MRSILEQAVLHHLNGEDERATELFHQFIVARARQIHESMRNGDEPLAEGWEEAVSEEFMATEDLDLAELEDDAGDEIDADLGDDAALGGDDAALGGDDAALGGDEAEFGGEEGEADLGDDLGGEEGDEAVDDLEADLDAHEAEDAEMADEIEALKAELEALTAEFEDMKAEMGGEGEDLPADDAEMADGIEDDMGDEVADDEPFAAMGESITSDLDKVEVNMKTDGKEIAAGGSISQQRKTALPQKKHDARQGGKPVELRAKEHKGFEREAAPAVTTLKPRRNNVAKAKDALSSVKK